jgi:hypothetical protein
MMLARILVTLVVATYAAAAAAPATAVFPFEIYDTSGEAPQPDRNERLAMATRVLSEALEKTGRFSPIEAEAYEHGVRFLIRNRLSEEMPPEGSAAK